MYSLLLLVPACGLSLILLVPACGLTLLLLVPAFGLRLLLLVATGTKFARNCHCGENQNSICNLKVTELFANDKSKVTPLQAQVRAQAYML